MTRLHRNTSRCPRLGAREVVLPDGRTTPEETVGEGLEVGQRDAGDGGLHQRRRAAGDEHQGQVAWGQGVHQRQHPARPFQPSLVGDWVTGGVDVDTGQWLRGLVAVADVDPSGSDAVAQERFHRRRHSGPGLPGSDDDYPVHPGQVVGAVADEEGGRLPAQMPGDGPHRVHRPQRGPD